MRGSETERTIDVAIGSRLRALRNASGLSQENLGAALGVTFQQVQKYEKGKNRVSVRQLSKISETLGCSVQDIIGGDPAAGAKGELAELLSLMSTREGLAMARAFSALSGGRRQAVVTLMQEFSGECS